MEHRRHVRARIARAFVAWLGVLTLLVAGMRTSPAMELLGALTRGAISADDASRTWQGTSTKAPERAEAATHGARTEMRVAKRAHDRPAATPVRFARVTLPVWAEQTLLRPLRVLPSPATRARALSMVLLN